MLKLRFAERWARLGTPGTGLLVLLILSAISLMGWWMAFEPARDPGGCVSIAARGTRGLRSCDSSDIAFHMLFTLAIGGLFGFLALRLLWQVGREFVKPLPAEPLGALLRVLLNLAHVRIQTREDLADGVQFDLLRLGRDDQPDAAFRLRLEAVQVCEFYPESGRPRDPLPALLAGTRLRFSPASRLAHPQHAHIDVSIVGRRFETGQLALKARSYQLEPLPLPLPAAAG
jgi:hypothetical protein